MLHLPGYFCYGFIMTTSWPSLSASLMQFAVPLGVPFQTAIVQSVFSTMNLLRLSRQSFVYGPS